MPHDTKRFRQLHNQRRKSEFLLKIRNIQSTDFGEYQCNVYANQSQIRKNASINLTGTINRNNYSLENHATFAAF